MAEQLNLKASISAQSVKGLVLHSGVYDLKPYTTQVQKLEKSFLGAHKASLPNTVAILILRINN
jgi:hypothetical protein